MRLGLRNTPFTPTQEYQELDRLVAELTQRGAAVILVNTPECPLIDDYYDGDYYRGYRTFFRNLAGRYPGVQFHDLVDSLPAEDFNDLMHINYVGVITLGPRYAAMIEHAVRTPAGTLAESEAHVDELPRAGVAP